MTDTVKQLAPQIWSQISAAKRILMHCHPSPDPDSIGSVLALYHALSDFDKSIEIIAGDSLKPETASILPGFDKISNKSWLEININDFDLFIICDSSSPGQITKKTDIQFPLPVKTIVIDHHTSNNGFANINLIDTSYPATCQIVADLLEEWRIPITKEIATCLILGIYTDTGGQIYPPTSVDTFNIMAKLVQVCPDYHTTIFAYENNNNPNRIKFLAMGLNNIHNYFSQQVAIAEITYNQIYQAGIKPEETEKSEIANYLISVKGWNIGITMKEKVPSVIEFSFRTRDPKKYPVSMLAQSLGGGGHPAAAGATLTNDFNSARALLLEKISQLFPDLGNP